MHRFVSRVATLFVAAILGGGYLIAQTIAISPGYVNLPLGGTQQYSAKVTGLTPATTLKLYANKIGPTKPTPRHRHPPRLRYRRHITAKPKIQQFNPKGHHHH